MRAWKLFGLAGLAGVATTVVFLRRRQRQWTDVEPTELRDRLHRRLADSQKKPGHDGPISR